MSLDNSNTPPEDQRDGFEKAIDRIAGVFSKAVSPDSTPSSGEGRNRNAAQVDEFFKAVKHNKLQRVSDMIADGIDPNMYNKSGYTALHIAARENLGEMIALLIEAKAIPYLGKENDPHRTPLEDAVSYGSNEAVSVLARLGGFVPGERVDGWSLLHRATEKGKLPAVAALLAAGADANERTESGATPLLIAIQRRQPEVAAALLDHAAVVDGMNVFYVDTDDRKRNALHMAIERGDAAIVKKMIKQGALVNKPDATGETPLEKAILAENLDIIRMLVQAGADIDKTAPGNETPLMKAVCSPEISSETARAGIVSFLIQMGADPDLASPITGKPPLHAAILARNGKETVRALLQHPLQLETRDSEGCTPIFHTIQKADTEILSFLLEHHADPNARNGKTAETPLIRAAQTGALTAAFVLLGAGANPSLCDAANKSALFYAREKARNKDIVDLLEKSLLARRDKERQRLEKKRAQKNGKWTF